MKKNFKYFAIVWFVIFGLFNAVTFILPSTIISINRFEMPVFWISYALIVVSFLAQLLACFYVCRKDSADKVFLNLPILKIGYTAIIASFIVGSVFMVLPIFRMWVGALVCLIVAGIFIIAAVRVIAAANNISAVDEKIKVKTQFMKLAVLDAETIMGKATTAEIKAEVKKVYEELRYSDYMSNEQLDKVESEIAGHLEQLKNAVLDQDFEIVKIETTELLSLIKERSAKCKLLK